MTRWLVRGLALSGAAGALLSACGRSTLDEQEPPPESAQCRSGETYEVACSRRDPQGRACQGRASCAAGVLGACRGFEEVCDGKDNDCNGVIDDGFVDETGAFRSDDQHCGRCGLDCTTLDPERGVALRCGGDPAAPHCVLACAREGAAQVGDEVDADGDPANGCECAFVSPEDDPGPDGGEEIDRNCDGADGVVLRSLYVAPDGDDLAAGTPRRPLRTIGQALQRASASLGSAAPRPNVLVAAGVYLESIALPEGVRLHGGYRRDFLAIDAGLHRVEVRAPEGGSSLDSGAALVARGVGATSTLIERMTLVGADAVSAGVPAVGALVVDPGAKLVLRQLEVRSGAGAPGTAGDNGEAGEGPGVAASPGDAPRVAVEDEGHECHSFDPNLVAGGAGGKNVCDGVSVAGGDGGTSRCPHPIAQQVSGLVGSSAGLAQGGEGGEGGSSREGPVLSDKPGCQDGVCCGSYYVPFNLHHPAPGAPGQDGPAVAAGASCTDPLGSFAGESWSPGVALVGTPGAHGAGGGGGGAGGGVQMAWEASYAALCGLPDAIGGGGGGGGAGGCGGKPGRPGTSGSPSIALLLRFTHEATWPVIDGSRFAPGSGGDGGQGGRGGQGAPGGVGASGTAVATELAATVPLSGTEPGARGGNGGNGSQGGGGGGGCGGAVVGLWLSGPGLTTEPAAYLASNAFSPGTPGLGGGAGQGDTMGQTGGTFDVVVR